MGRENYNQTDSSLASTHSRYPRSTCSAGRMGTFSELIGIRCYHARSDVQVARHLRARARPTRLLYIPKPKRHEPVTRTLPKNRSAVVIPSDKTPQTFHRSTAQQRTVNAKIGGSRAAMTAPGMIQRRAPDVRVSVFCGLRLKLRAEKKRKKNILGDLKKVVVPLA